MNGDQPMHLPPVATRVTASYPATDGRAPESIEIVWEIKAPQSDELTKVIAALAAVTRDRLDGAR